MNFRPTFGWLAARLHPARVGGLMAGALLLFAAGCTKMDTHPRFVGYTPTVALQCIVDVTMVSVDVNDRHFVLSVSNSSLVAHKLLAGLTNALAARDLPPVGPHLITIGGLLTDGNEEPPHPLSLSQRLPEHGFPRHLFLHNASTDVVTKLPEQMPSPRPIILESGRQIGTNQLHSFFRALVSARMGDGVPEFAHLRQPSNTWCLVIRLIGQDTSQPPPPRSEAQRNADLAARLAALALLSAMGASAPHTGPAPLTNLELETEVILLNAVTKEVAWRTKWPGLVEGRFSGYMILQRYLFNRGFCHSPRVEQLGSLLGGLPPTSCFR